MKTKKLTLLALLAAIALTIFMLEAQIPSPVPIPGVKLGLANIVTVFTVFVLGPKEGAAVLAVRVFLGGGVRREFQHHSVLRRRGASAPSA